MGARGRVEFSQCTTTSAATDGTLIGGSGTTGEGSFAANGTTTRFLVLLRFGIMRLCRFHFSHDPGSHAVQTEIELGAC